MTSTQKLMLVLCALAVTGCATPARMEQMQIFSSVDPAYRPVLLVAPHLKNQVFVHDVTGGEETNPMLSSQVSNEALMEALEASLRSVGLLGGRTTSDYRLVAHLEELDQPWIGTDMTVIATVNYSLEHRKTGRVVLARTVRTSFTAAFSDASNAGDRVRLANEGAVRKNISAIIKELIELPPISSTPH